MTWRLGHWCTVGLLGVSGALMTVLGVYLLYLGGSVYYFCAGLAALLTTRWLVQGRIVAIHLYGVLLFLTALWALYESGPDFLALLPRLAFWLVISIWFLTPGYRASLGNPLERNWPAPLAILLPGILSCLLLAVAANWSYEVRSVEFTHTDLPAEPIRDWRHYGNTVGGTRFAELEQINAANVGMLQEAWRFRTGVEDDFKMTPLNVDGYLYLCGARNVLIAIDADSGNEIWRHDPKAAAPDKHQYARTCRGISYYQAPTDYRGECPTRIVTATIDARLIAVDALTGVRCDSFGTRGAVNLRRGMGEHKAKEYYHTSPPLVAGDRLVVGGLVVDSQNLGLPSGVVRAFDAVSGDFQWAWDVGRPDEPGEPASGEAYTRGTPNVWSLMSFDPALNLIYAPTGNAAPDYFGGARREFDDAWSSSVVALDADTGRPRWSYQTVHHDIWDYDVPAQPVLVDVVVDGARIPSVAVPTKTGEVFLLDRRHGTPVHPTPERPVPQDPAPGEYLAPTQPASPLPHFHPFLQERDMWGLTPLDQMVCRIEYRMLRYEGLFTPPTPGGSLQFPANFGGFNWGSVSVDADHGLLVASPMLLANRTLLVTPEQVADAGARAALLLGDDHPAVWMDPAEPRPAMGSPDPDNPYDHRRIRYYGLTLPFMSRLGTQVPCFEPPWSRLAVIDLNSKMLLWSRPVGSMKNSGPFNWRTGLPFQVGTPIRAGTLTTRGGLIFLSSTMDSTVRAFDLHTGAVLWSAELPGSGQATPMSYYSTRTGKQYLIVTVPNPSWRYPRDPSSGTYTDSRNPRDGRGGYVIAYTLP